MDARFIAYNKNADNNSNNIHACPTCTARFPNHKVQRVTREEELPRAHAEEWQSCPPPTFYLLPHPQLLKPKPTPNFPLPNPILYLWIHPALL